MDVHNIANLESPLYNTLVSKAQRDPWTYSLLANVPSFSKQRVEVAPSGGTNLDMASGEHTYHFKIPRYGLLSRAVIKTELGAKRANASCNSVVCDGFGWYCYKDVTLQTHNKRIQQLTPEYLHMRAKALPGEPRKAAENRARDPATADILIPDSAADTSTDANQFTTWTDLPFAFSERPQNYLDTRFVENLEIVATSNTTSAYGNRLTTLSNNNNVGNELKNVKSSPKLVCYFINPTEELYRAYQERNFTLERPLTMLWYDIFVESPAEKTGAHGTDLTLTKKLDCNNLVFMTHIMVSKKTATQSFTGDVTKAQFAGYQEQASQYMPLDKIVVSGTSRSLVDSSGFELMNVDQENYGRISRVNTAQIAAPGGNVASIETSPKDCIYTIHWGLDGSRTSCSGALSLKNIAAPEVTVKIKGEHLETKDYQLKVVHEFFQLVSVQGSDGRVSVGVSV